MGFGANFYAKGRLKSGERNLTEAAYERFLGEQLAIGMIKWFKFEAIKLRLADNTFLTMDFAVLAADGIMELHDTKGSKNIFTDDARVKIKVASDMYPFVFKVYYPRPKRDGGGWIMEEF